MAFTKSIGATVAIGTVAASGLFVMTPAVTAQTGAKADVCEALPVVDGNGATQVNKTIKKGLGFGPGNLNTDFAVPAGVRFAYYVLEFKPANNEHYDGSVTMKYADDSTATVFDRGATLVRDKVYYFPFRAPTQAQPYQLNLWVGSAQNNAYQASIWACNRWK